MSLHPYRKIYTVEVIFSGKNIAIGHHQIRFIDIPVMKDEHKHLGVNLDSKLSFSAHINAAISKARRGNGGLRLLPRTVNRSSLCET